MTSDMEANGSERIAHIAQLRRWDVYWVTVDFLSRAKSVLIGDALITNGRQGAGELSDHEFLPEQEALLDGHVLHIHRLVVVLSLPPGACRSRIRRTGSCHWRMKRTASAEAWPLALDTST